MEAPNHELSADDLSGFCDMAKCKSTLQVLIFPYHKSNWQHYELVWVQALIVFPLLAHLDISACQLGGNFFLTPMINLKTLKSKNLSFQLLDTVNFIELTPTHVEAVNYFHIFAQLPNLRLVLTAGFHWQPMYGTYLVEIGRQFKGNIMELEITIDPDYARYMQDIQIKLAKLLTKNPKLKKLTIKVGMKNKLDFDFIETYLQHCPHLEALHIDVYSADFSFLQCVTEENAPCLKSIEIVCTQKLVQSQLLGETFKSRMPHVKTNF